MNGRLKEIGLSRILSQVPWSIRIVVKLLGYGKELAKDEHRKAAIKIIALALSKYRPLVFNLNFSSLGVRISGFCSIYMWIIGKPAF